MADISKIKLDSSTYNIKDSTARIISNYSSSEQVIGTWTNGKPLYRSIIDIGNLPDNSFKNVGINIPNINKITSINGIATDGTYTVPIPSSGYATLGQRIEAYIYANSILSVATGGNYSSFTGEVIIEYTKSTD